LIDTPNAASGGLSNCGRRRKRAEDHTGGREPTGSDEEGYEEGYWPGYCVGFGDAGVHVEDTPDSPERT
jgi:hypothetical protein